MGIRDYHNEGWKDPELENPDPGLPQEDQDVEAVL